MPIFVNANRFEDLEERSKFIRIFRRTKGITKTCREMGVSEATFRSYINNGKNPDPKYDPNRRFAKAVELYKRKFRKNKKK